MSENIDSIIPEDNNVILDEPIEKIEDVVEPEPVQEVIALPEFELEEQPNLAPVAAGVIGSTTKKVAKPKAKETPKVKKDLKIDADSVAIYSTRNVFWEGVGKLNAGYNIVTKDEADQWLTRNHVHLLSPEELAKEFNL